MKALNPLTLLVFLPLNFLSLAQASPTVCIEGQAKVALGKAKKSDALLKLQMIFSRNDGIVHSFTKEVLNPENVLYVDDNEQEVLVGDLFPKWPKAVSIALVQSPLTPQFTSAGNPLNFESRTYGGGNGKWILSVQFRDLKFDPQATDEAFLKTIQQIEFVRTIRFPEPREWFREKIEDLQLCGPT